MRQKLRKWIISIIVGLVREVLAELYPQIEAPKPFPCPTCGAPWTEHRCPFEISKNQSQRRCEVCSIDLPIDAVRTHHGKWFCSAHKGQL